MADTFYDGMPNVNEELNKLVGRGPVSGSYNRAIGMSPMGGPNGFINSGWLDPGLPLAAKQIDTTGFITAAVKTGLAIDAANPRVRLGATSSGEPSISLTRWTGSGSDDNTWRISNDNGIFRVEWSIGGQLGYQGFNPLMTMTGVTGRVDFPLLKVNSSDQSTLRHNISRGTGMGQEILYVGVDAAQPSVAVLASDGLASWGTATSVMYVGKNSETGRSVSLSGQISTMGNDHAEYVSKTSGCALVQKGQIVGMTAENKLTDKWAEAVMFLIKSTDPSFVGGDSWAHGIGPRPIAKAGIEPAQIRRQNAILTQQAVPNTNPIEYVEVVVPGDTDEEWAQKQARYATDLAAYQFVAQQDAEAMASFEAALEAERQKVDRVAIAGRVPVNVWHAQPGDYIVPVQDGTGIKGIAIHQTDLTHLQYLQAVGRVISIEPDGRAYVMVKAV